MSFIFIYINKCYFRTHSNVINLISSMHGVKFSVKNIDFVKYLMCGSHDSALPL